MAEDRLMFGIGFDLNSAVDKAEKDFEKVLKDLQKVASKSPVSIDVSTKEIEVAKDSIIGLRKTLSDLGKEWDSMSRAAKFDPSGNLTAEAKRLIENYSGITAALQQYGQSLKGITADIKEQAEAQMRYLSNDEAVNKAIQARTVAIQAQRKAIEEADKAFTQLNAQGKAYAAGGGLTTEAQSVVNNRIAATKELQRLTASAAAEQRKIVDAEKQTAREAEKSAAAQRKRWQELRRTLSAEETSLNNVIAKLKVYQNTLNSSESGSRQFNNAVKEINRLSAKLEQMRNNIANLTGQAVAGQRRMTAAVQDTNRAYSSTEGYITRLIKRSAVLFGIHQVSRFTQKLRETTAEFELQRVSLGAIIQDTEKANALFNQIKTFAVQSPFEIKDLVGYVKQLSAYRIETDKLFDTTKRLADVSAGLGVDMGRLILAYGQVKAASVLRGQEVRQFTEAGIPLIQLLADKFTALRGEVVSTSEVFDLISKRAVSFEMVAEIFEDMTNAGGMFYNMQEKQAQTLAGQWSNLKDALSIMYDEMGNTKGAHAAMENMISLTKTLAQNWQLVGGLIMQTLGGAAILGVVNKIKSLWNMLGVQMYSATEKVAVAQDRYNAAVARQNALLPTATNLERAAAAQKVKTAAAALKSAKAIEATALSSNKFTFALKRLGAVIKANPLGFLISVALTLYQVISHLVSKSNELKNALADIGAEGAKNITVMTRNFELLANKAVQAADGSKAQKDALDELQRTYKDMIPTHLLTIENLRNMAGSYDILTTAIQEYCRQQMLANQIETIVGNTTEKISKAQTKLRKKLKDTTEIITTGYSGEIAQKEAISLSFDEQTIERAFAGIEKYARTTADSVQDIIRNAFKDFAGVELTDKEVQAISELGGFANNMYTLVAAYREQETEIKRVTEQQKALTGEVGLYGDLIDAATEKINNFSDEALKVGTYEFDTAKAKTAADEYVSVIKRIFQDSGLTFEDAWVDGKFIDIDSINKALVDAGNKVSSQAHKAFGKIATAYYELVPSDVFSKAINKKFEKVAGGMNVNMDLIKKYLKDSNTSIDDFVKNFFSSIDELEKNIQRIRALLQQPNLSESDRVKKSADLVNYEQELEVLKALIPFIQLFNVEKSKSGGTDDRLSKLKEEVSLLEKVYAKYQEYTKYISKADAQERINREFGKTLDIFKQYGIELPKTSAEYQAALKKLQDIMRKLPKSQKDVLELGFKIENVDWEDTKRNLEDELKRLSDEVSRTKTAKEFFDKMLNMTGDRELSATVTMSVYGDTGKGLHDAVVAQIREAFKGIDDTALNLAIGVDSVDYNALQKIFKDNFENIPKEQRELIQQILDNQQKANAEWLLDTFKVYEEFKTFEQQRTIVMAREAEKRKKIAQSTDLDEQQKKELTDASLKREAKELNDIDWAEFKASDDWIKTFENIDRVATPTIEHLIVKLRELIDTHQDLTPEQLRTIMREYDKLYNAYIERNPFKGIIDGIREFKNAQKEIVEARSEVTAAAEEYAAAQEELDNLEDSDDEQKRAEAAEKAAQAYDKLKKAEKALRDAQDESKSSLSRIASGFNAAANAASGLQSILSSVVDLFGIAEDSELGAFLQEIGKWLGIVATSLALVASIIAIIEAELAPLLAAMAGIAALGALFSWLSNAKVRKANREIEKQQKILDALEHSYNRLQKAADQLFGSEFVANFRKQQENLRAQIVATEKQLAAERSKGSKKDDDKIKEYEEQIQNLKDQLEDMQGQLAAQMLGTDLASAARSFAQSWLDAYKEFGDTAGAIEERMSELMENLMTEAILGAITQKALEPLFKYIDSVDPSDFYKEDFWKDVFDLQQQAQDYMNTGLSVGAQYLEQMGILTRNMGSEMTGISKDIASASEESILGLSSLVNTSLYYVSNIDRNVAQITALLGGGMDLSSNEQLIDIFTIQNQHLAYLPNIALNTAQTAERCERAAQACESIAENLNRVIKPNGVPGTHRVVTSIQS